MSNVWAIAYRELRRLEIEVLKVLHPKSSREGGLFNVPSEMLIDVDQMYGIEIEEWPAQIAKVALWLVDHQMNVELSEAFGDAVVRLPLTHSARIANANALLMDWNEVLPADECQYVLGNPPFLGHHLQTEEQKADQHHVWHDIKAAGVLDYVTGWYRRAAEYIQGRPIECAFVSTNSISQGEQPGIFWPSLLKAGVRINFAHRTFRWESEARGKAHVHVVVIGFGLEGQPSKHIWEYQDADGSEGNRVNARSISPYLFEGPPRVLTNRTNPICDVPGMKYGNKPTDGGHFIMSPEEREALLAAEPDAEPFVRRYLGASDFLDGSFRYCLWLKDITPDQLRKLPTVAARVAEVRKFRQASKAASTRKYADYPTLFRQIAQPDEPFIVVPGHTSESRPYIPFAYFGPEVIASNACFFIPGASLYHFGVIHSTIHMTWVRQFCGRIKSDYRYSKDIVYNNFPWPPGVTEKQRAAVEAAAQAVIDAREQFPDSSLADLYHPELMPVALRKAHDMLDRAVERCYRPQPFPDERRRVEYLFELWETLERPLAQPTKKKRASKRKKAQA